MHRRRRSTFVAFIVAGLAVAGVTLAALAPARPRANELDSGPPDSGYEAASVRFILDPNDSRKIDAVTFTLETSPPAGSSVRARIGGSNHTWYPCRASGARATCPTTSPPAFVESGNRLQVVVAR